MDMEDALSILERKVAADVEPVLDEDDMEALITIAQRPDEAEALPTDGAWVPTYDLDFAAAEGWRWKAARAAARFDFGEDGQTFSRSQVYSHCVAQAEEFARRSMGSIPITSPATTSN